MQLSATVGQVFSVELSAGPTTGYRWEAVDLPPALADEGGGFDVPPDARIGDSAVQRLRFRPSEPGHYRITLHLRRPWEATPIETKEVDVEVGT